MTLPAYSTNKPFGIYMETRSAWYKLPWGQGFEKWIVEIFLMFIKLLLHNTKQGWNGAAAGGGN